MYLIDRFDSIFPDAEVSYLTGDREFVGKEWLTYLLLEPKIPFCLRIRNSDLIGNGRRQLRATCSIFRYGLDYLRSILTDLDLKKDEFLFSLKFLSCT